MFTSILHITIGLIVIQTTAGHREHKVHNIVLYPDKQSWCKTTAIKQVVTSPGYKPTTIDNNVCVGACFSYSIPRTQPAEPGELIVPYCDSCQPVTIECYHVTLTADDTNTEGLKTTQKRVQIIRNCTCLSCEKKMSTDCEVSDENTAELPVNLFANRDSDPLNYHDNTDESVTINQQDDIPELLNFIPNKSRSENRSINLNLSNITTKEQKYELNSKLIGLLKSIQEQDDDSPNFNYDKVQLKELLKIIEGSEAKLSDKNLMEFVNFVNIYNSEDLELDLSRLKEVLTNFQREQQDLLERHRQFGLGPSEQGLKSDPLEFGNIKNVHSGNGHGHGNVMAHNSLDSHDVKLFDKKHYLGEEQKLGGRIGVGHLVIGPHRSFVLEDDHPSGVEEKLNVEPHLLKPNHAGTVLAYENHKKV